MTPLIQAIRLKKYFPVGRRMLHAVDDVSFSIPRGKTFGVVGESGCGKTTLGRTILGLQPATDGQVLYEGRDITKLSGRRLKELCKEIQIIFQDPYSSLNPRHSVGRIIGEPMRVHGIVRTRAEQEERVRELMATVGLADRLYHSYPHELDGGRRQRVGIARALGLSPKFIVCDEPVSALDVSVQAQILNLLMDLQRDMGLTYMFITHNLSVVKHISDEIMVMYLGQCVERAPSRDLFKAPKHPYTRLLLSAIPVPSASARERKIEIIKGELTSPIEPKPGCRFASRCPQVTNRCAGQDIPLREVEAGHLCACVLYD
jgi:oligopeptide/dipeptide ABC transporter ATP-binding protein